jgi:hypothetical protein
MATSWCILRCQGRVTLRLAETLAKDGFETWTPREFRRIRIPRANVRREAELPLLPSYVFARSTHLIDLLELAAMPVKPRRGAGLLDPAHAGFTVMHWQDSIPLVEDRHLNGLRLLEAKRTPRQKAERRFPPGVSVRVMAAGGSFAGMRGRVERSDTGTTLVCFDRRMTVKIATSLLLEEDINISALSSRRRAA